MPESYLKRILSSRVYDVAVESPLDPAPGLSGRLGRQVWLKREDLQPIFSFKCRGAYNCIAGLAPDALSLGVVAASAGNHAQGVALAARKLGIEATIVMGRNTPGIKVSAVKRLGARVVSYGDTFDDAYAHAQALKAEKGLTFVHPFDDREVIAGQGTVGMEILRQCPRPPAAIYIPVGGGGLAAGVAAYVKYVSPSTRIIGVEAEGSACLAAALQAGRRVTLRRETLDIFADGVSVAQVGKENFRVLAPLIERVVTVDTDAICAAVKDVFEEVRVLMEPAGALAVAGMKKCLQQQGRADPSAAAKEVHVAITSGANVNFDRLRHISERAEVGEQREALFAVQIPEAPGAFRTLCHLLGKRLVTEFNYRHSPGDVAQVFIGIQTDGADDREALGERLRGGGYDVIDLTENELAKLHLPHIVGGRSAATMREVIYRFEFPERPGALMQFLNVLGNRWNITLFHYRNHGAAFGRILCAFDLQQQRESALIADLEQTGYRFHPETTNPAYQRFLGPVRA